MNKKFFMAALAGLLTVCGLTATAADDDEGVLTSKKAVRILAVAKPEYKLSGIILFLSHVNTSPKL